MARKGSYHDITGQTFGMLTAVSLAPKRVGCRESRWHVRCACGGTNDFRTSELRSGKAKSCGCLRIKHRGVGTREYGIWRGMKARCSDERSADFPRYGGRGIKVCERWQDFCAFIADMGPSPAGTSIERIDNDGHYEPGNCRWATGAEQARNKSNNRVVPTPAGEMLLCEAAELSGLNLHTLRSRIKRGWPVAHLFNKPRHYGSKPCL